MNDAITAIRRSLLAIACTVLGLALSVNIQAQEPAQQQEWMVKPTKEHELFKSEVGTWDAAIKVWHSPDAEPMESKGSETNELMPGGMWLISQFEGNVAEFPFTGHGQMGYDPVEKKYVGTWIDSMTPFLMLTKGTYDPATKVMTSEGESRDAVTKQPTKMKLISRFVDEDSRSFEMHVPGEDGKFWKMMQIDYTRRGE